MSPRRARRGSRIEAKTLRDLRGECYRLQASLAQEINKRLKNISESDKLACKTVRLLPFGNDGESVIRRVVKHGTSCFGLCRRIFSTGA